MSRAPQVHCQRLKYQEVGPQLSLGHAQCYKVARMLSFVVVVVSIVGTIHPLTLALGP